MPGNGWWCCCGCIEFTDTFIRDDAATLGGNWTYTGGGAAGISSNRAYITAGEAYYNSGLPDDEGSFAMSIVVDSPQDNDIYDVIISFDGGTSESLVARFEVDAGNSVWLISLRSDAAELVSDSTELIAGCGVYQEAFLAGRTFVVSYDREVFRVGGTTPEFPHYELWTCEATPSNTDIRIGFRHGGGPNTLYFDNFWISDHYMHDKTCPAYGCLCGLEL